MVRSIILIASVLALLMSALIGYIGFNHIKEAYLTSFSEGLHAAAILVEDELSNEVQGDWSLSEDGQLLKGETPIHALYQEQLDALNQKTGMHFT